MHTQKVDPSLVSARCFRAMLEAMSRPGSIQALPEPPAAPESMPPGLAALCLTLADMDSPLWLDPSADPECGEWLRFHCGCPLVQDPGDAALACVLDPANMPELTAFSPGHPEYPDRSTTVFIPVRDMTEGRGTKLKGPGIKLERLFEAQGLPQSFWKQWKQNSNRYPQGVDVFFVSGSRIAGLPRSVRAEVL